MLPKNNGLLKISKANLMSVLAYKIQERFYDCEMVSPAATAGVTFSTQSWGKGCLL